MNLQKRMTDLELQIKELRKDIDAENDADFRKVLVADLMNLEAMYAQYKDIQASHPLKCPMCDEESLTGEGLGGTTMWSCEHCPFVGFEYYRREDILQVLNRLEGDKAQPVVVASDDYYIVGHASYIIGVFRDEDGTELNLVDLYRGNWEPILGGYISGEELSPNSVTAYIRNNAGRIVKSCEELGE